MQLYVTEEALPAQSYYAEHWTPVYLKSEVDAVLAAKDAEIATMRAQLALAEKSLQEPHPDAARLDKLPQCFHMLRFRDCQWHFTFDTNRQYYSLRDAIDAYNHPAVTGIDQGQFLAACGGGNAAFGERNSGGTPE